MDATIINNYSSPNQEISKYIRVPDSGGNGLPVNTSNKIEVNYDNVLMNLEDVKNFLFMLIGSDLSKTSADNLKGRNINTLV